MNTRKSTPKRKPKAPKPFAEQMDAAAKISKRAIGGLNFSDYAEVKFLGGDGVHDPFISRNMGVNIPKNYSPRMMQEPINVRQDPKTKILTIKQYTAADYKKIGSVGVDETPEIFTGAVNKEERIIWPKYYQNPYQFQDYVYLQDIYANTIAGRIFETVAFFAIAEGVKPKLKVKNESDYADDEARQKELYDHQWMIDEINEIEKNISTSNNAKAFGESSSGMDYPVGPIGTAENSNQPTFDHSLQKKWYAALIMQLMFGRVVNVPRVDPEDNEVRVKLNGKETIYKNIPKIMMVIHPRDLGFNYIDYKTHRILGIQLNNSNWILRPDEMIFWEWMPYNPVYGSLGYGMSAAQSMMGSSRTLRRIIEVDFPLIAKTRWSGMYWLVFKQKGEDLNTREGELDAILSRIELNGINATLEENPVEDFALHKIDLDPKIAELLQTVRDLIQYMMSQVGMPQGLLYGEEDLNRDTFKSKIATWTKGPLKRYRTPFLEGITKQWYARLGKTLAEQSPEWEKALEKFEIIATVDEFKLDSREDLLNAMQMLENITGPWTDKARAEFLEIEDLAQRIDPTKDISDAPQMSKNKYKIRDNKGQEFSVDYE